MVAQDLDTTGWRSLLFVPGSRPDRFEKACTAGADLVCIDLEDAVAPAGKAEAREATINFLRDYQDRQSVVGLRVNAVGSEEGEADLKALAEASGVEIVLVPKVMGADDIDPVRDASGANNIIPVLEQARAIQRVDDIADHDAVIAAIYGAIDLAADIGCTLDWDAHLYGRSKCAIAFGAARKVLFDVPFLDVADEAGLMRETKRAQALGIHARTAIHPKQLGAIHAALAPSEEEIAKAKRIVEAFEAADSGVALLDGKMIELPVIKAAQRVLKASTR